MRTPRRRTHRGLAQRTASRDDRGRQAAGRRPRPLTHPAVGAGSRIRRPGAGTRSGLQLRERLGHGGDRALADHVPADVDRRRPRRRGRGPATTAPRRHPARRTRSRLRRDGRATAPASTGHHRIHRPPRSRASRRRTPRPRQGPSRRTVVACWPIRPSPPAPRRPHRGDLSTPSAPNRPAVLLSMSSPPTATHCRSDPAAGEPAARHRRRVSKNPPAPSPKCASATSSNSPAAVSQVGSADT